LRKVINNEWLLILNGALSILFGVVLLLFPASGALALIVVIGVYAILFGALLLALACPRLAPAERCRTQRFSLGADITRQEQTSILLPAPRSHSYRLLLALHCPGRLWRQGGGTTAYGPIADLADRAATPLIG
jgi:hypothetical protein